MLLITKSCAPSRVASRDGGDAIRFRLEMIGFTRREATKLARIQAFATIYNYSGSGISGEESYLTVIFESVEVITPLDVRIAVFSTS